MKKITKILDNRNLLYIFTILILVVIPLIKQISFYLVKYEVISDYDSINTAIVLFISLPFLIFIYFKDLYKTKRKLDIYDYLIYILIIVGFIVTLFSINRTISIFGKPYRHEGLLSLMAYYFLFINWKINGTKKDIHNIIKLIIIITILNSIYGLLQIYTKTPYILRYSEDMSMASGLCGNPNFFGSLVVVALGLMTGKFLIDKQICKKKIFLIVLFLISLINCQSTGPFISYAMLFIFLIIYLLKRKKLIIKNMIVLIITILITSVSIYIINNTDISFKDPNGKPRCELCDIKTTVKTGGNGRITIWENSIKIVKKHWLIGVGYDNFHYAYNKIPMSNTVTFVSTENGIKAIPVSYMIVDNAHNVYLHILTTSGVLGLLPYLVLCLLVFICALKKNSDLGIMLLSGFITYSIQAFANISVITVAPIYFIIMGLILSIKE